MLLRTRQIWGIARYYLEGKWPSTVPCENSHISGVIGRYFGFSPLTNSCDLYFLLVSCSRHNSAICPDITISQLQWEHIILCTNYQYLLVPMWNQCSRCLLWITSHVKSRAATTNVSHILPATSSEYSYFSGTPRLSSPSQLPSLSLDHPRPQIL